VFDPLVLPPATFSAGILGTFEPIDGVRLAAGMDWMHVQEFVDIYDGLWLMYSNPLRGLGNFGKLPTTVTGTQNISPYNQSNGRSTYIQLTNSADAVLNTNCSPAPSCYTEVPITVHVQIFNENCEEIVNFCDDYTGNDTHEYDLRDLFANDGQNVPNITDGEGYVVMTPVKNCDSNNPASPETAIDHNYFAGEFEIVSSDVYRYGAHTYARQSVCEPPRHCCLEGYTITADGSCKEQSLEERHISGCELDFDRSNEELEAEFCDDALDQADCLQRLLSAYVCEPGFAAPAEDADLIGPGTGVCVPNPIHQGRPCESGDFPFNFCGFGQGDLPDGRCVLTDPGALLDGTCQIDTFCEYDAFGRGCLTGSAFSHLETVRPDTLFGQFNVLPDNTTAGSDLILVNFRETYIPFNILAGYVFIDKNIHDDQENPLSCGTDTVCYARYGVDEPIVIAEEFVPPTLPPTPTPTMGPPTGTPTPPPTLAPTLPPTSTPTPTNNPFGGGSSSCAIAGSPVQLGTALANVLIPLVPVAFAFGVRAVRRRKK
jgi:hypothetical protein